MEAETKERMFEIEGENIQPSSDFREKTGHQNALNDSLVIMF